MDLHCFHPVFFATPARKVCDSTICRQLGGCRKNEHRISSGELAGTWAEDHSFPRRCQDEAVRQIFAKRITLARRMGKMKPLNGVVPEINRVLCHRASFQFHSKSRALPSYQDRQPVDVLQPCPLAQSSSESLPQHRRPPGADFVASRLAFVPLSPLQKRYFEPVFWITRPPSPRCDCC